MSKTPEEIKKQKKLDELCEADEKQFIKQINGLYKFQVENNIVHILNKKKVNVELEIVNPKETCKLLNWMYSASTDGSDGIIFAGSKIKQISWDNNLYLEGYSIDKFLQQTLELLEVFYYRQVRLPNTEKLLSTIFDQLFRKKYYELISSLNLEQGKIYEFVLSEEYNMHSKYFCFIGENIPLHILNLDEQRNEIFEIQMLNLTHFDKALFYSGLAMDYLNSIR